MSAAVNFAPAADHEKKRNIDMLCASYIVTFSSQVKSEVIKFFFHIDTHVKNMT